MIQGQRVLRSLFFSLWAVVMTGMTYVLGAPSLKALRRQLGRPAYWALTLVVSGVLYCVPSLSPLAFAFLSLSLLMGVFEEFEDMGFGLMASALFTVVINSLVTAGGFALWVFRTGPKWDQICLAGIESLLKPVVELNPHIQINYFDLMLQLPSVLIILWLIALYVSVLLEPRLMPQEGSVGLRPQLATIRLPDACVWLFIASLLGAFVDFHWRSVEALSVNAMNVCLLLFFFQGIAVVAKVFERLRMGAFLQVLFMVLIVVQLFLFVSLLGLLDYWLDFRQRLTKRSEEFNRET